MTARKAPRTRAHRLRSTVVALLVLSGLATASHAQWRWGRRFRYPPRFPQAHSFDGQFNFCRLMYQSVYRERGGQGWSTDYPSADINFSIRLGELTKTTVSFDDEGHPNHLVIRATDPALFRCPWVLASDVGTLVFDEDEVQALRTYLLKGGFLWVDDFWGSVAWENWASQIARVLPPGEYPIVDIPPGHAVFRTLYRLDTIPQIPSIRFWRNSGGGTSERGDRNQVAFRGIMDQDSRIMVLMTHNTDISDAWEREGDSRQFFALFSPDGYAVGINVVLYSMTH